MIAILLLWALAGATALAAGGPGEGGGLNPPTPGATPAPTPPAPTPEVEAHIIPGEQMPRTSLDKMLDYLKDKVPGFNSAVVREPDVLSDYPTLPDMTLKNVTVGQLLELVRSSYPGVDITRIDGPNSPLYVVTIRAARGVPTQSSAQQAAQVAAQQAAQLASQASLFGQNGAAAAIAPQSDVPLVHVYRLNDIVQSLASQTGSNDTKKAMEDILSLIQAALDQAGGNDGTVSLKVHEPTQTIVFKGSPRKMVVLEQVLETLRPRPGDPGTSEGYRQRQRNLEKSVAELEVQVAQLKAASATTRPKDQ
jgi:hypothetical protein